MPLMDSIAAASLKRIQEFCMLNLANTAWAEADLIIFADPLSTAISSQARRRLSALLEKH